ncbi:hypothetical protein POM88_000829 [Heracleum sosnowskyi]|uniref:TIR domain-containing protein n=1 Tax=Heracleum sosnowskyi TaxID=360622 RepID=A0AAD8N930_9APIA|nr:hypothetical protein POM88_000829 [Heracleum sosnowskyi]
MDTRNQLVIPIFYDVEPWEVRHQGGSFAEAFACHGSGEETRKLEAWKSALTRVADLKGWDVAKVANGCEATVISQVMDKVYRVLKTKTCLTGPINLVGMSSRISKIKSRWDDRSTTGANFIGFYGMGGVGKTTTAHAFYDFISGNSFEGQYVLENIGECSKKGSCGLLQLQERLLSSILNIKDLKLDSLAMGTAWMSVKLSFKKVLIIFDDIDKPDQVRALVGERSWFGPGSTVMITTRDRGLLQMIPVDVEYAVELLGFSQSKELFTRHAFEGSPVPEPHKKLLHDIVHYCGGLPLALQILGSHLFNKPLKEWKHTLDKVRLVPMFEIQDKLRISYDGLDVDEKTIFLDIVCLFIGDVQDDAITILNACNLHAAIGVSSLIQKCLLTVKGRKLIHWDTLELLDGISTHVVHGEALGMHDLLRDMGRHIVREESQRIGERSCLWIEEEVLDVLKYNKGTRSVQLWEDTLYLPKLKTLNLSRCTQLRRTPNLTGVKNLKILLLGKCSMLEEVHPSIGHLSRLVKLVISDCKMMNNLPNSVFNMSSLRHLNINNSTCSLPVSISGLCSLEYLGVSGLLQREVSNDIGSLSSLNVLELYQNRFLTMPASLSQLLNVTSLDFSECVDLESIPGLPPNLKSLCLYLCIHLKSLPALLPPTLVYINAWNCSSLEILPYLGNVQRITELILVKCRTLKDIQGLGNLPYIKELHFTCCTSLQSLSVVPPNLKTLNLCGCTSLKSLPAILPPTLEYISARNCMSLENLPNLGHLQRLTSLILLNCSRLNDILGLGSLFDIEGLSFSGCTSLESLTALPPNLKRLNVNGCRRLRSLPEILPTNLEYILASGCVSLEKAQNSKHLQSMIESIFRKCSRLDDILGVDNLLALSLINYQGYINLARGDHTLQSLIMPPFSQYRPEIAIVMPKIEIPDWFICGKNEDPICIDIPHSFAQRFIGFTICFICTSLFPFYDIVIDNQTSRSIYIHKFDNGSHLITDDVISVMIQVQNQILIQGGDSVKIYASPTSGIEKIGVYLVYKKIDDDQRDSTKRKRDGISGYQPRDIPKDIGSLSSLIVLELYWNPSRTMPSRLSHLESLAALSPDLKTLSLCGCKSPPTLECITAKSCMSLEQLPNSRQLQRMTSLILTKCIRVNDIQCLGNLLYITELIFAGSTSLESPTVLQTSNSFEDKQGLSNLLHIEELIFTVVRPNLKRLDVNGCKRFQTLLEIPPTSLEHILAKGCLLSEKVASTRERNIRDMTGLLLSMSSKNNSRSVSDDLKVKKSGKEYAGEI